MKDSLYAFFDSTVIKLWEHLKAYPFFVTNFLVLLIIILNFFIIYSKNNNTKMLADLPVISEAALQEKICYFGIESILKNNISSLIFHQETYKALKRNPDLLELENAQIIKVSVKESICRVVLKDEQGPRVFDLQLFKSTEKELGMVIANIDEQYLNKEDEE